MMRQSFYIILLTAVVGQACTQGQSSGSDDDASVVLEGKINHPLANEPVLLEEIGPTEVATVDTLRVAEDSTFRYALTDVEPGFYRINFYGRQYVNLILDNESVHVTADGDSPDGQATVEGSTDTDPLQRGERDHAEHANADQ